MTAYRHQGLWRYDFLMKGKRYRKSGFKTKRAAEISEAEAKSGQKKVNSPFALLIQSRLEELSTRRTKQSR